MRTAHRITAAAVAVVMAALFALVCAAPASAANELALSWDGRTWQPDLTGPIFAAPQMWVPGDTATGRFYVRNQSADPASLAVQYKLPPSALVSPDNILIQARVASGAWVRLAEGTTWLPVDSTTMAAGNQLPVDVRASFDPASNNPSQLLAAALSFHLVLTGDVLTPGGPTPSRPGGGVGGDSGHDGNLSDTGAHDLGLMVAFGAGLLGIGLALTLSSRRREKENTHG